MLLLKFGWFSRNWPNFNLHVAPSVRQKPIVRSASVEWDCWKTLQPISCSDDQWDSQITMSRRVGGGIHASTLIVWMHELVLLAKWKKKLTVCMQLKAVLKAEGVYLNAFSAFWVQLSLPAPLYLPEPDPAICPRAAVLSLLNLLLSITASEEGTQSRLGSKPARVTT